MSAVPGHAPRLHAPAALRREKPKARARPRRRSAFGGVLMIVVAAVLLAGVVAINVAVLQLNLAFDDAGRDRAQLRAENAALRAQLSSAAAAGRTADRARATGLEPVDPNAISYIDLRVK